MAATLTNIQFATQPDIGDASFEFGRGAEEAFTKPKAREQQVHLRIQQRTGRKSITTVQGLADDLDLKKILKAFKRTYNTNGTIVHDDEVGEVIQLAGDQRKNMYDMLIKCHIIDKEKIKIHGF